MVMKMENKNIFMLDTNVLIALSEYHYLQNIDAMFKNNEKMSYNGAVSIAKLYDLIDNKKIKVYISDLVVDEINQGIKKYGTSTKDYLVQSNIEVAQMTAEQIELSTKLGNHYFNYKTVFGNYAFDTHDEKYNGLNDAFIMSDATILGLDLITFDNHFNNMEYSIIETNKNFKKIEPLAQYPDMVRPLSPSRAVNALMKNTQQCQYSQSF